MLNGARLLPDALRDVEAHGTGTFLGDSIEIGALVEGLLGSSAVSDSVLMLGATKASMADLRLAMSLEPLHIAAIEVRKRTHADNPIWLHPYASAHLTSHLHGHSKLRSPVLPRLT